MKQQDLEEGLASVSKVNKHCIVSDSLTRRRGREDIPKIKGVVVINTRRRVGVEVGVHTPKIEKASAEIWQRRCQFVSVRPQANSVSDPLTGRASLVNWLTLRNNAAPSGLRWWLSCGMSVSNPRLSMVIHLQPRGGSRAAPAIGWLPAMKKPLLKYCGWASDVSVSSRKMTKVVSLTRRRGGAKLGLGGPSDRWEARTLAPIGEESGWRCLPLASLINQVRR